MIKREKSHIVYLQKKKEKPPKYLQNNHMHGKPNWKNFFRKDSPNAPNVFFFKLKNIKPSFTAKLFPNLASEMLSTSYPSKINSGIEIRGQEDWKEKGGKKGKKVNEICSGIVNEFAILASASSDPTRYCMTHWLPEKVSSEKSLYCCTSDLGQGKSFQETPTSSPILANTSCFIFLPSKTLVLKHTDFEPEIFMYIRAGFDQEPLTWSQKTRGIRSN